MKIDDMKLAYQAHSSLNVNLNRQSYGPLDLGTVFKSLADLEYYRTEGQLCASVATYPEHPYPYAGQIVSLVDNDLGTVSIYKLVPNYELSVFDKVQLDAQITPGDLPKATTEQYGAVKIGSNIEVNDGVISVKVASADDLGLVKVGDGINVAADGTISAQLLNVDQDFNNTESTNPVSTKAVAGKIANDLTAYVKKEVVAGTATTSDQIWKNSDVSSYVKQEIEKLDSTELTIEQGEFISSISEVDGKLYKEKGTIALPQANVVGLTSDLTAITSDISYLGQISSDHEGRLTALEADNTSMKLISGDLSTAISTEIDDRKTNDTFLSGQISAIAKDYALSSDVSNIVTSITAEVALKYNKADFEALSNDIGLSAANTTNKVVTFKDIKDLEGSMHFKGVTTTELSTGSTVVPEDIYGTEGSPKAGDVVIHESSLKEFVWGGTPACWHELGKEGIWATKASLDQEILDRQQGDADTLSSAKEYTDTVSAWLSADYGKLVSDEAKARGDNDTYLSSQISAIATTYALSSDVSAIEVALKAQDTAISNGLTSEVARADASEQVLSGAIDKKISIDGVDADTLSVLHSDADTYHSKVIAGTVLSNELYIVSNDFINAYGEQIKNLSGPTDDNDAATKKYVDDEISSVEQKSSQIESVLSDLSTYTYNLSASQIIWDITTISCGSASS